MLFVVSVNLCIFNCYKLGTCIMYLDWCRLSVVFAKKKKCIALEKACCVSKFLDVYQGEKNRDKQTNSRWDIFI